MEKVNDCNGNSGNNPNCVSGRVPSVNKEAFISTSVKNSEFNELLNVKSEEVVSANSTPSIRKYIESIGWKATKDWVILRGTTYQSILGITNKTIDNNSTFEYIVVAIGEFITGLDIGDSIGLPSADNMHMLNIDDNEESVKKLSAYYSDLGKKNLLQDDIDDMKLAQKCEENKQAVKVRVVEYFLTNGHGIPIIKC